MGDGLKIHNIVRQYHKTQFNTQHHKKIVFLNSLTLCLIHSYLSILYT